MTRGCHSCRERGPVRGVVLSAAKFGEGHGECRMTNYPLQITSYEGAGNVMPAPAWGGLGHGTRHGLPPVL